MRSRLVISGCLLPAGRAVAVRKVGRRGHVGRGVLHVLAHGAPVVTQLDRIKLFNLSLVLLVFSKSCHSPLIELQVEAYFSSV
jgi:hypothetical protein